MTNRQTCGIRLHLVPQTRGLNLQDLHPRHATLPHLHDGVANSEKAYENFSIDPAQCRKNPMKK